VTNGFILIFIVIGVLLFGHFESWPGSARRKPQPRENQLTRRPHTREPSFRRFWLYLLTARPARDTVTP
jgi:hypothetical protein